MGQDVPADDSLLSIVKYGYLHGRKGGGVNGVGGAARSPPSSEGPFPRAEHSLRLATEDLSSRRAARLL